MIWVGSLLSLLMNISSLNDYIYIEKETDYQEKVELTDLGVGILDLYFKHHPANCLFDSNEELVILSFEKGNESNKSLKISTGLIQAFSENNYTLKGSTPEYEYVIVGMPSEYFIKTNVDLDELSKRNQHIKEFNENKYEMIRDGEWNKESSSIPDEYDPAMIWSINYSDSGHILSTEPNYLNDILKSEIKK